MAVFMARKRRRLRLALEIENCFRKRRALPMLQSESKQQFEKQCAAHWKLLLNRALREAKIENDDYLSKDQIAEIRENFWLELERDLTELAEIERRDQDAPTQTAPTPEHSEAWEKSSTAISRGASFPYAYEFNRRSGTLTDLKTGTAFSGSSISRDEGKVPGWVINQGGHHGWAADIYTRFV